MYGSALLAIRTFTKDKQVRSIHLLLDNMTALAHLTKMGRPTSLTLINLTKEIWSYLLQKGITLTVEYIPSILNKEADFQSRNAKDWSEWKLNPKIFQRIKRLWGFPSIDLFASRTSHQLPRYYSWRPDPHCLGVDALTQKWDQDLLYAFPPFCLIGRSLEKIRKSTTGSVIIITPIWITRPWYPVLLEMLIDHPRIIQTDLRTY